MKPNEQSDEDDEELMVPLNDFGSSSQNLLNDNSIISDFNLSKENLNQSGGEQMQPLTQKLDESETNC